MKFTLGACAEITVENPTALKEPIIHRIPSVALVERLRVFAAVETRGWVLA